jgi:hypothetical protein
MARQLLSCLDEVQDGLDSLNPQSSDADQHGPAVGRRAREWVIVSAVTALSPRASRSTPHAPANDAHITPDRKAVIGHNPCRGGHE